jgi:hypothetical protein
VCHHLGTEIEGVVIGWHKDLEDGNKLSSFCEMAAEDTSTTVIKSEKKINNDHRNLKYSHVYFSLFQKFRANHNAK